MNKLPKISVRAEEWGDATGPVELPGGPNIRIEGSREALSVLAQIIQRVATSEQDGCHTHVMWDDEELLAIYEDRTWLTIGLQ